MQNFGPQTLNIGSQAKYFTGVGWEYLTVINLSPYILDANFSGLGSITIAAWLSEDVRIPSNFTGQIVLTPNNYLGLTQIVSQVVSVNAWSPGELKQAQSVSLTQNFGNIVTATATNLVNDGNPAGTTIIESTQAGSPSSNINIKNNGFVGITQFVGGTSTQLFAILPNVSAGLLNANVVLSDSSHATQVNGSLIVNNILYANAGINAIIGSVGNTAVSVTLSGTSTQNGVVVTPQTGTRNFTDFTAGGAEISTVGVGYAANSINQGFFSNSNVTGIAFQGAHSNAGIDLTGITTLGSGPAILAGALPIKATTSQDLLLDVTSTGNAIRLRNNGVDVLAILNTIINAAQLIAPNAAAFATVSGSVSGTCSLYCAVWGSGLKIGIYQMLSNYNTAVAQTLLFPSTINFGMVYSGSIGPNTTVQFNLGASAAAMRSITGWGAANTFGTDAAVTNFHQLNIGQFGGSDRFIVNTTGGNNINSFGWFIGQ